jgi:hypothetical protein
MARGKARRSLELDDDMADLMVAVAEEILPQPLAAVTGEVLRNGYQSRSIRGRRRRSADEIEELLHSWNRGR